MQKIVPHLWFDTQAKEAAEFYVSTFPDSKIVSSIVLEGTPSGAVDSLVIEVMGYRFAMISAGPIFKITPAVSFLVSLDSQEEVESLWGKLSDGGKALMELGEYPFSKKYGWVQDKFGVSWQLMFMKESQIKQKITPTMMFVGAVCGKAEEAITLYTSVFHNAKVGNLMRYGKGEEPDKEGTIKHMSFTLEGDEFAAMDSAREHKFIFTEAVSFMVNCETQEELDYYTNKLSSDPSAEQCGWLKDKYGFSWQITPVVLDEMMQDSDKEKVKRVTQAFLKMKRFNIVELKEAYENK